MSLVLAEHGSLEITNHSGVVEFAVKDKSMSVTPARAKQILEDALEALNKWSLEQ